jgi:hypothetical protein
MTHASSNSYAGYGQLTAPEPSQEALHDPPTGALNIQIARLPRAR